MKSFIHYSKKTSLALCTLLATMGFVACKNQDKVQGPTDTTSSGVIEISADESFAPVLNQEIDVFENEYDQASIIPIYKSEVDAINLLLQDSV